MVEYPREEDVMDASTRERGHVAAAGDEDPNVIWFAEQCQTNQVRFEALIRSAEWARDPELAAFFRRAQQVAGRLAAGGDNSGTLSPAA